MSFSFKQIYLCSEVYYIVRMKISWSKTTAEILIIAELCWLFNITLYCYSAITSLLYGPSIERRRILDSRIPLVWSIFIVFIQTAKILISLSLCLGWSEFSLAQFVRSVTQRLEWDIHLTHYVIPPNNAVIRISKAS